LEEWAFFFSRIGNIPSACFCCFKQAGYVAPVRQQVPTSAIPASQPNGLPQLSPARCAGKNDRFMIPQP
jgi:hypothetical protein